MTLTSSSSNPASKLKQSTLGGFFSSSPSVKSTPRRPASPIDARSNPSSQPASDCVLTSDEDAEKKPHVPKKAMKSSKRKSVIAGSSSDEEAPLKTVIMSRPQIPAFKKPRYSCRSSASVASSSKSYAGALSSDPSVGDLSENDIDDPADEDTNFEASFKPSKTRGNGKAKTSHLMTNAEKAKNESKLEAQGKQAPWAFLRDIKDADGNPIGSPNYDPRTLYISKKDWANMTPFEIQFWEIKQNHFDTILFFQKGKFSELYEGDAMIGHQEFDLKITKRVKMSMVGVPESSVDFWIAKFLAKGYKVGKVDQCETALGAEMRNKGSLPPSKNNKLPPKSKAAGKDVVRRELRSVVTSGTIVDSSILTADAATCLLALKEKINSSGLPIFGVIIMDAATAEFNLTHFEDSANRTHLETIMSRFKPKEILYEKSGLSTPTLRILRNIAPNDCTWTALKPDEFLDVDECVCRFTELFQDKGNEIPAIIQSFYSKLETMQAFGGLLWYLKQLNLDNDLLTCKNIKELDAFRSSKTMQLDGKTISDLELLQSDVSEESQLLKLLNRCITPFGKRLFRHWLCSPLQDTDAIRARFDAVEYLINCASFEQTFSTLSGLPDLERLISRVHAGACTVPNFLKILSSFRKINEKVNELRTVADAASARLLEQLLGSIPDLEKLLMDLESLFTLDGERRQLHPLEGKDETYDMALEEERGAESALQMELKAAKKLLKTEQVVYKDIGIKDIYQIQVPAKVKVPSNWIKMSGTKDCARYYTPQSTQLVKQLKQAREKKSCALRDFHLKVFVAFDQHYLTWLEVIKLIAQLDCILSLAKASMSLGDPVCRPQIEDSPDAILEFRTLRHPCAVGREDSDFIANDVAIGGNESRMILLTGPNMAGKSTLLRMTCVATIMAQIGCFIPAESAKISPVDKICTRMGASDHIFAHASTFKVEMDDARKILVESTSKSLVILDELGRGTSTFDGHAIAFAVLHRLATHSNCLGFFATHYSALTEDFELHANIAPKYMLTNVDEVTREVIFLYKLASGTSPRSYGPHVAKMAGISSDIVQRAISISEEFERDSRKRELETKQHHRLNLVLQADTAFLIKAVHNGMGDGIPAREKLKIIQRIQRGIRRIISNTS